MKETMVSVSLTLIGDDFDLAYVSNTLNILPTYTRNKDEVLGNGRLFGHTEWGIGTDYEPSHDIGIQIQRILDTILDKEDTLQTICTECNAQWHILVVIYIVKGKTPIMILPKKLISIAAAIEAQIGFDTYVC